MEIKVRLNGGRNYVKKVGILANGGDVSGFNAVIRAIVKQQKSWSRMLWNSRWI